MINKQETISKTLDRLYELRLEELEGKDHHREIELLESALKYMGHTGEHPVPKGQLELEV